MVSGSSTGGLLLGMFTRVLVVVMCTSVLVVGMGTRVLVLRCGLSGRLIEGASRLLKSDLRTRLFEPPKKSPKYRVRKYGPKQKKSTIMYHFGAMYFEDSTHQQHKAKHNTHKKTCLMTELLSIRGVQSQK